MALQEINRLNHSIIAVRLLTGPLYLINILYILQSDPYAHGMRVITLAVCFIAMVFHWILVIKTEPESSFAKILTSIFSLMVVLVLLEMVFTYLPRSNGIVHAFQAKNWEKWFFKPINSLGYRDKEPSSILGKRTILAIGDSHTEGAGITNIRDRYQNRFESLLSGEIDVYTVARSGLDTQNEWVNFEKYPVRPNAIILGYCVNDIDLRALEAYKAQGKTVDYPIFFHDLPEFLKLWVGRSYLANFIYWYLPHGFLTAYTESLKHGSLEPEVLSKHLADLNRFVEYSRAKQIPMAVVLIPELRDYNFNSHQLNSVENFFKESRIPVIDIRKLAQDWPISRRVVNRSDAHMSAELHAAVAIQLQKQFQKMGFESKGIN